MLKDSGTLRARQIMTHYLRGLLTLKVRPRRYLSLRARVTHLATQRLMPMLKD